MDKTCDNSDSHCGGSQANKWHGVSFLIKITGSQIVFQFFKYPFGEAIFSKNAKLKKKKFLDLNHSIIAVLEFLELFHISELVQEKFESYAIDSF